MYIEDRVGRGSPGAGASRRFRGKKKKKTKGPPMSVEDKPASRCVPDCEGDGRRTRSTIRVYTLFPRLRTPKQLAVRCPRRTEMLADGRL